MTDTAAGNLQKAVKSFYVGTSQCLNSSKKMFSGELWELKI